MDSGTHSRCSGLLNIEFMDSDKAVLEYSAAAAGAGSAAWGFKLKFSDGQTLIESARTFDSQAEAELGFVSMIKLIATNHYTIRSSVLPDME